MPPRFLAWGWVMYYGFDMGGTKIELGVFDDHLQRIWQKRVPTPREDYRQLLATLCDLTPSGGCVLWPARQRRHRHPGPAQRR